MAVVFAQAAQEVTMARRRKSELQLEGLPARVLAGATNVSELAQSRHTTLTYHIRLEPHVMTQIDLLCERFGWSRGEVIRDAVQLVFSISEVQE